MKTRKSLYLGIKDIWQLLPTTWNARIRQVAVFDKIIRLVAGVTVKNASHQEIYDMRYSDFLDTVARKSTAGNGCDYRA